MHPLLFVCLGACLDNILKRKRRGGKGREGKIDVFPSKYILPMLEEIVLYKM